jgi:hypothetical protein
MRILRRPPAAELGRYTATRIERPSMAESKYRVAIVADPGFGERIEALAEHMHVWAVDTPANRTTAERLWATMPAPSIESGVTIFRVDPNESPDAWAAATSPDVELHHGEYSHNPPLDTIEIHGAPLSSQLRLALNAAGFTHLGQDGELIIASRPPAV